MNKYIIFIWGTGTVAEKMVSSCSVFEQYEVMGFIDNNVHKVGKLYKNHMIYSPDVLKKIVPDKIVILSNFYEEIKRQILDNYPYMQNLIENKYYFLKEMLRKRYENSTDKEVKIILEYLKSNSLDVFNYNFKNKYKNMEIEVLFDEMCGMFFVYHCGKRMYFSKRYNTKEKVREYYRDLLIEQDILSPHRYLTSEFNVKKGDIVIDVGVAEGNFSLEIIDKVSKIYLIETDDEWIEAIQETFKKYQDKIVIIKKHITSISAGKYATLDSLIDESIDFIKMDIEGNEWDALIGAKEIFKKSKRIKSAICVYHHDFDEILVRDIMNQYGVKCSVTPGYMWYPFGIRQIEISTKLCRGIVRGVKEIS